MRRAWLPDSILNYLVPDPCGPPHKCVYTRVCVYARNRVGARAVLTVGELRQESVITDVISRRLDLSMAYHAPPRSEESYSMLSLQITPGVFLWRSTGSAGTRECFDDPN